MKRALVTLLGLLACGASADVPPPDPTVVAKPPFGVIDLSAGALERLASDDPARYVKVAAILRAAELPRCDNDATRLLKAREDLKQMRCADLLLTSYPAKRHIYFVLEGSAYSARVTMRYGEATLRKAGPEH